MPGIIWKRTEMKLSIYSWNIVYSSNCDIWKDVEESWEKLYKKAGKIIRVQISMRNGKNIGRILAYEKVMKDMVTMAWRK